MDLEGLIESLETNPQDPRALNVALKSILSDLSAEDALTDLDQILDVLFSDGSNKDTLRRTLDARLRPLKGETDEERIILIEVATRYWRDLGAPDRAEAFFRKLKGIEGYEDTTDAFYTEFYLGRNNWRRVEELYFKGAGTTADTPEAIDVFIRLAELARSRHEDTREAQYLDKVNKLDDSREEVVGRLIELNRISGRWHVVANLLAKRAEQEDDLDELGATYTELIRVYSDEMGIEAKALGVYQTWRSRDPQNDHVTQKLLGLLADLRRWPNYVKLLREAINNEKSSANRKEQWVQLAGVYQQHLRNVPEAIKALEEARDLDPEDGSLIEQLKALYRERRDFSNYIMLVREELATVEDSTERLERLVELAKLAEREIRKPDAVLPLWEAVIAEDPGYAPAQEALVTLYERTQSFDQLLAILEERAQTETDPKTQASIYERIAIVSQTRLKDPVRAAQAWESLLEVDANHVRAFAEVRKHQVAQGRWDDLERLFDRKGMLDDFGRILESQARKSDSDKTKANLLERLVSLYSDKVGDATRALRPMEQLLGLRPDDVATLQRLVELSRTANDTRRLTQGLNALAPLLDHAESRKEVYLELADLAEQRQMKPGLAFTHIVNAYQEAPSDLDLMSRMAELSDRANQATKLLQILETVFPEIADTESLAVPVALEVARRAKEHDPNQDRSVQFYSEVLGRNPIHEESLEALLADAQRNDDAALQIRFLHRLAAVVDGGRSVNLRADAAKLQLDTGDMDGAEHTLQAIIEEAPLRVELRVQLEGLYLQQERYEEVALTVESLLQALDATFTEQQKADAYVRLTMAQLLSGFSADDAYSSLLTALSHVPDHEDATAVLIRHLNELQEQQDVLLALEQSLGMRGRSEDLADVVELIADRSSGSVLEDRLEQLLGIYRDDLEDQQRSFRTLGRLYAIRPKDHDLREILEAVADDAQLWPQVVDLYGRLSKELDPGTRRILLVRSSEIELGHLEDPHAATEALERLIEENGEDREVLDRLASIYANIPVYSQLANTWSRLIPLVELDESKPLRISLANLLDEELEQPEEALGTLQEAQSFWADDLEILRSMRTLHQNLDHPEDHEELLRSLASLVEGDERHVYLVESGTLCLKQLEMPEEALERSRSVLSDIADHGPAIALAQSVFTTSEDAKFEAAQILYPSLRSMDRASDLVPVLETLEEASQDDSARAGFHIELADLYLGPLSDEEMGELHLRSAAERTPHDAGLRDRLVGLAEQRENMAHHINFLERLAEESDDLSMQVTLFQEAASLLEEKLSQLPESLERHAKIIRDLDGENRISLDTLLDRTESMDSTEAFLGWVDSALDVRFDSGERAVLFSRAIDKARQHEELETSLSYIDRAQEEFPTDLDFRRQYVEVARSVGNAEILATGLTQLAQTTDDASERAETRMEASVILSRLEDREDDAIYELGQHLSEHPDDRVAVKLRSELYERLEAHEDLVEDLKKLRTLLDETEADESTRLALRLARSYGQALDRPNDAVHWYDQVVRTASSHSEAIEDLEALLASETCAQEVYALLDYCYESNERHDDQVRIRESRSSQMEPCAERANLNREAARMAEDHLTDPSRALENLMEVISYEPSDRDLREKCEALASAADLNAMFAGHLGSVAESVSQPELQAELLLQRAELYLGPLADLDEGIQTLSQALELHPVDEGAQQRLDDLYVLHERHDALSELLDLRALHSKDDDRRHKFMIRRADLFSGPLDEAEESVMILSGMVAGTTGDTQSNVVQRLQSLFDQNISGDDIFPLLDNLYTEQSGHQDLAGLLGTRVEQMDSDIDRVGLLRRLGTLQRVELSDPGSASQSFSRAWHYDPNDASLKTDLYDSAVEAELLSFYVDALSEVALKTDDEVIQSDWMLEEAQIRRDVLGQRERSEAVYRSILEIAPDRIEAYHALDSMLDEEERFEELATILDAKAELQDGPDQLGTWHQLAALQTDTLDQFEGARSTLSKILDASPADHDAHEKLATVLERLNDTNGLALALKGHAEVLTNPDTQAKKLARAGSLYENAGDREAAIETYEEASMVAPDDLMILRSLTALVRESSGWERLSELLNLQLGLVQDDAPTQIAVQRELATILAAHLDDGYGAMKALESALDLDPQAWDLWDRLRMLANEAGQSDSEVKALEALLASQTLEHEKTTQHLRSLATLRTEVLPDFDRAVQVWSQYLSLVPLDKEAHLNFLELLEQTANYSGLAEHLGLVYAQEELEFEANERLELRIRQADLHTHQLKNPAEGARLLEALINSHPGHETGWMNLEQIYRNQDDSAALASLLVRRVDTLEDTGDIIASLREAATLYSDRLDDHANALLVLLDALQRDAEDVTVFESALDCARTTEDFETFMAVAQQSLSNLEEEDRVERCVALAEINAKEAGDTTGAIQLLEHNVAELGPKPELLAPLCDLLEQAQLHEAFVDTLNELFEAHEDTFQKIPIARRRAKALETNLNDRETAIRVHESIVTLEPTDLEALLSLERLYGQRDPDRLDPNVIAQDRIRTWERLVDIQPNRQAELYGFMGQCYQDPLQDMRKTAECFEHVVTLQPTEKAGYMYLEQAYGELEDWDNLGDVYERMSSVEEDPLARAAIMRNLALVREAQEDLEGAVDALSQALIAHPEDKEALEFIERLYRQMSQIEDLVYLYRDLARRTDQSIKKVELLGKAAEALTNELDEAEEAERVLRELLEIAPDHLDSLVRWQKLMKIIDIPEQEAKFLAQLLPRIDDEQMKSRVCRALARTLHVSLGESERALGVLGKLDEGQSDDGAILELKGDIFESLERWEEMVGALERRLAGTEESSVRAQVRFRLGKNAHREQDDTLAIQYFETALQDDPHHADVIQALADIYLKQNKAIEAEPLLGMLVSELEAREVRGDQLAVTYRLLGDVHRQLLDPESAYGDYQSALEAEPGHIATQLSLGELAHQLGQNEVAKENVQSVLDSGEIYEPDDMKRAHLILGEIELGLGNTDGARDHLMEVMALDPTNEHVINEMVELGLKYGDFEGALDDLRTVMSLKRTEIERYELLLRMADIAGSRLEDHERMESLLIEAMQEHHEGKAARVELLKFYRGQERYHDAILILESLAEVDSDPERAYQYLMSAAKMAQDLDDSGRAVDILNMILDQNPDHLEAFATIDKFLTESKDWQAQEQNYRRMLNRVSGKPEYQDLQFKLYMGLGEIYRSRIKDVETACDAFELALKIKPEDITILEILADLYGRQGNLQKTVGVLRNLARVNPGHSSALRTLFMAADKAGDHETARVTAQILVMLKTEDTTVQAFHDKHVPQTMVQATGHLDLGSWQRLLIPDGPSAALGEIFAIVYRTLGDQLESKDLKSVGLRKKDEIDQSGKEMIASVLRGVSDVLGLGAVNIYRRGNGSGITVEPTMPPCVSVAPDMLSGRTQAELAYALGKHLSLLLPMHALAAVYDPARLRGLLFTARLCADPSISAPVGATGISDAAAQMREIITPTDADRLSHLMHAIEGSDPQRLMEQYLADIETASIRAGQLVGDNLSVSKQFIMDNSGTSLGNNSTGERVRALVRWMLSDRYRDAREYIGATKP